MTDQMFFVGLFAFLLSTIVLTYWVAARRIRLNQTREISQECDVQQIRNLIGKLLDQGISGAFLIITDMQSGLWVQFRKFVRSNGQGAIELAFPRAEWSEKYFTKLIEYAKRNDLDFFVEREDTHKEMKFLYIDVDKSIPRAVKLYSDIMSYVFEVEPKDTYYCNMFGIEYGEEIGSAERHRHVILRNIFMVVWVFGLLSLIYGLLIRLASFIFSFSVSWHMLSFDEFDIQISPIIYDVVCIFMILFRFAERIMAPGPGHLPAYKIASGPTTLIRSPLSALNQVPLWLVPVIVSIFTWL